MSTSIDAHGNTSIPTTPTKPDSLHIQQVANGFIVDHNSDRLVFQSFAELQEFLSQHFNWRRPNIQSDPIPVYETISERLMKARSKHDDREVLQRQRIVPEE